MDAAVTTAAEVDNILALFPLIEEYDEWPPEILVSILVVCALFWLAFLHNWWFIALTRVFVWFMTNPLVKVKEDSIIPILVDEIFICDKTSFLQSIEWGSFRPFTKAETSFLYNETMEEERFFLFCDACSHCSIALSSSTYTHHLSSSADILHFCRGTC